jgi:hypothetical protein
VTKKEAVLLLGDVLMQFQDRSADALLVGRVGEVHCPEQLLEVTVLTHQRPMYSA